MSSRLEDLIEIANPQQPHCPVVFLLDISGSMAGDKISALTEGVKAFKQQVEEDDLASKRVDLAIITFGHTSEVVQEFISIKDFEPALFTAEGFTPMAEAISNAIQIVENRKQQYKESGIDYFRPWIFMITDGEPTDMQPGDKKWREVVKLIHKGEEDRKFMFFAVAVEPANVGILSEITSPNRKPVRLKGLAFPELFSWLSRSMQSVSGSTPGEKVSLESPIVAGWGEIAL